MKNPLDSIAGTIISGFVLTLVPLSVCQRLPFSRWGRNQFKF